MKFAAFVMTYRRTEALEDTINKLFSQTFPPQKILIIDNDPEKSAESIVDKFSGKAISYYSVGYNSGPAGAAYYGLKILAEEDWDWIAWVDDDDPPVFDDIYSCLLQSLLENPNCGCVGVVGHLFNTKNGLLIRLGDESLEGSGFIEVDNIAGGMSKIINGKVVRDNKILPDKELFFGFEELDFDISLKKAGYILLVDKPQFLRHRFKFNRIGLKNIRGNRKSIESLWREYYSARNILIILKENKFWKGLIRTLIRLHFKIIRGFRYGFKYGYYQGFYVYVAIFHFLIGKKGLVYSANQKPY